MPELFPFLEAVQNLRRKKLLPTNLGSSELSALDAAVKRESIFSARTTIEGYLNDLKKTVESVVSPSPAGAVEGGRRPGEGSGATPAMNPATAREFLRDQLADKYGYRPTPDEEGTIKDLSSDARINLVVKTNTEMAQGAGQFIQQNFNPDTLDAFPALELFRLEERQDPRDWPQRWRIAAQVANDPNAARVLEFTGRMVALKSSGIWQAMGDGAGGYQDTLGNPFPPFAFNSGMWTEEISRESAQDLGLIGEDDVARAAPFDLTQLFNQQEAA